MTCVRFGGAAGTGGGGPDSVLAWPVGIPKLFANGRCSAAGDLTINFGLDPFGRLFATICFAVAVGTANPPLCTPLGIGALAKGAFPKGALASVFFGGVGGSADPLL
jgi:hypothetical protein